MKRLEKDTIDFVSRNMQISFAEAEQALRTDDEIFRVLFTDTPVEGKQQVVPSDLSPEKVDVREIAANLNLDASIFTTFVEDDLVWIMYGDSIPDDIAGQGPTPFHALADFYRRWYNESIKVRQA